MHSKQSDVFELFSEIYANAAQEEMSLQQYLLACREDKSMYASAPERMVEAIGEPNLVDTSKDERLGRIFSNRTVKIYPSFSDFYGMEDTIERIVGYFRYASQGLEERKQILYLLGPVGGGKSSLAERLKKLMEQRPIYTLKVGNQISPVFELPLGLFHPERMGRPAGGQIRHRRRRLNGLISPWAAKRLDELRGDISKFSVVKLMPSRLRQIGIAKTEPGDENNQDVSALVGKVDIRQAGKFQPVRSGRLFLQRRPEPDDAGPARIRRDVQGADQGPAPAADGDAGGQLQRHREFRRLSLPGHHRGPFQRIGMAAVQEQQEQRGLPRPHLRGQGALLPADHRRKADLRKAAARKRTGRSALRAGGAGHSQPIHGFDPSGRARQFASSTRRCGSMTART